jgi:electron transfer flavoprotein alpha subunit
MAKLFVHQEKINRDIADALTRLCPFSAIHDENGRLEIDAACKMCRLCVKNGPAGVITWEEDDRATDGAPPDHRRGIAVFAEISDGRLHNVVKELIGKARQLAGAAERSKATIAPSEPVYALLIGGDGPETARAENELLRFGVDKVFSYCAAALSQFQIEPYTAIFSEFISEASPSSVLVGATSLGRLLAPRVAAKMRTGITADCTALERGENDSLIQIRPAFGGNIMAQIVTPRHRPQFCTVRYKVFPTPEPLRRHSGVVERMPVSEASLRSSVEILATERKPKQTDIAEARAIVAVGRGFRKKEDLKPAEELADILHAQLACSRPLVENGWFDPRRQIGLSGRTVNAEIIITLGISGAVQFAAGMRGSGLIIAVNSDPRAAIFNVAHYSAIGDVYEIVPLLINRCKAKTR